MTAGEIDLLIDGTNLETLVTCVAGPLEWPYQGLEHRGNLPEYPGYDGAGFFPQPYSTRVLPLNVAIKIDPADAGAGYGFALNDALNEIRLACKPDQEITLTRRINGVDHTARGRFLNITPSRAVKPVMTCLLEFTLLDGVWYGDPVTQALTASTTFSVLGTTRTYDITVHLPGGSGLRDVRNTSNGYEFTFNGTTPGSGVDVDVLARTALVAGGDLSRFLRWFKPHLLRLDPGFQTIQVTGSATSSLTYRPAFL